MFILNEDLFDDLPDAIPEEPIVVNTEPEVMEEPTIQEQNNAVATMLIDAINGEWETIDLYNNIIVNLDNTRDADIIAVIQDIVDEENIHVGQLQRALAMVSPQTDKIADGEQEAEEQLTEDKKLSSKKSLKEAYYYDDAVDYIESQGISCDPNTVVGEYVCDLLDDEAKYDKDDEPIYSKKILNAIIKRAKEYKIDDEENEYESLKNSKESFTLSEADVADIKRNKKGEIELDTDSPKGEDLFTSVYNELNPTQGHYYVVKRVKKDKNGNPLKRYEADNIGTNGENKITVTADSKDELFSAESIADYYKVPYEYVYGDNKVQLVITIPSEKINVVDIKTKSPKEIQLDCAELGKKAFNSKGSIEATKNDAFNKYVKDNLLRGSKLEAAKAAFKNGYVRANIFANRKK